MPRIYLLYIKIPLYLHLHLHLLTLTYTYLHFINFKFIKKKKKLNQINAMLFISENFLNSFKVSEYTLIIDAVVPEFSTAGVSFKKLFRHL